MKKIANSTELKEIQKRITIRKSETLQIDKNAKRTLVTMKREQQLVTNIAKKNAGIKVRVANTAQAQVDKLNKKQVKAMEKGHKQETQAAQKNKDIQVKLAKKSQEQQDKPRKSFLKATLSGMGRLSQTAGKAAGLVAKAGVGGIKLIGKGLLAGVKGSAKAAGAVLQLGVGGLKLLGKGAMTVVGGVHSVLKSMVLMPALKAAFSGMKSMFSDAVANNRQFQNSMNLVKGNLSAAFYPIAQSVMPALNAMAGGLAYVANKAAQFTSGFFGTTISKSASALKGVQAVQSAAKKAGGLASFDEINKLDGGSDSSESAGGMDYGGLGGMDYGDPSQLAANIESTFAQLSLTIPSFLAAALGKAAEFAPQFVNVAVNVISSLLNGFNLYFPQMAASGITILQTVMDGINQLVPSLVPLAVNILTFLAQAFLTYVPSLLVTGIELFTGILQGIAQALPGLIPMAQQAITTVVGSLAENLPIVLSAGMMILQTLMNGIVMMLPTLIPMIVSMVQTIITSLQENLPALLNAGIEILLALINGVIQMIPMLIPMVTTICAQIEQALIDHLPEIIQAGVDLLLALIQGMLGSIDVIIEKGPELIQGLVTGLIQAIPVLIEGAGKIISALGEVFTKMDWGEIGRSILQAIGDGLKAGWEKIKGFFSLDNLKAVFTGKVSGELPKFASGGIVSQPTLAMVGDNRRSPEAIAPLHELYGMIQSAVYSAQPSGYANTASQSDRPMEITLQLGDGSTLARWMLKHMNRMQDADSLVPILA